MKVNHLHRYAARTSIQVSVVVLFLFQASAVRANLHGDLNCDGAIDVLDVVMSINVALGLALPVEVDGNQNNIPDACDSTPTTAN